MRQTWITAPGSVEVREVAGPVPAAGEVLVEVAYAGICGSDLYTLRRGHPWLPYPIAPGHEASGVVIGGPGPAGTSLAPGRRVYLRPAVSCGDCFYCARGRTNLCASLIGVGSHLPGAFADRFVVPPAALAPVPDGVSLAAAAMVEPLATAVHAVTVAAPGGLAGATVAVLGGGTIGQCTLLAARAAGASAVVLTDPVAAKRALAAALGATTTVDPLPPPASPAPPTVPTAPSVPPTVPSAPSALRSMGDKSDESGEPMRNASIGGMERAEAEIRAALGGRPDVVFDCVASRATLASAVRLALHGGTVVVVGVGHGPMDLTVEAVQDHELRIAGSAMYVAADFEAAERLIAGGAPVERLITSVRPLAEAPAALAAAAAGDDVKIHLAGPQGGSRCG